ncbi:hypothetical protein ACWDPV_01345 [Gordonia sp. NPDC003504]
MTDFFVLPGTRVPLEGSDMPSYQPDDGPIGLGSSAGDGLGGGGVVQVVDAEWGRRAAVARGLAGELAGVAEQLGAVGKENSFGIGAKEGEKFYEEVLEFIAKLRGELTTQTQRLDDLASQCDSANASLHTADVSGADGITI